MRKNIIRLTLFALLVCGLAAAFFYRDVINPVAIQSWVEQSGVLAPLIFMLVYILATVLFVPGSMLTLIGGAVFGPVMGVFYNLTAATIGAILSFLAARYLASDWVEKKSAGTIKELINGVEKEGWRFVAFVRLVPIFPFNLLNYALGLTRIRLSEYSLATFICMLPGAIAYTYLGYIGREAATGGEDLIQKIMLALALLAVVAFLPRFVRRFRNDADNMITVDDLKQRLDRRDDLLLLDVRTEQDYQGEQGHIEGSVLLPVEQLKQKINQLQAQHGTDKTIVTICRTDRKSAQAAKLLLQHGFNKVYIARMGMTDWIKQGYPLA